MSDVPSNLIPTRITGLPEYLGTSTLGYLPYVFEGNTYKVQFANIAAVGAVPSTRQINSGSGLGGGGDLSANRTLYILPGGVDDSMLTTTGVTAGNYGAADSVPVLTINAQGRVTAATLAPIVLSNYVPISRTITAGTGLSGGGDLSANRSFAVNFSSTTPEPLGPGTPGVSTVAAREDHVHPAVNLSDTTETQGVLPLSRGGTGNSLSPVAGALAYSSNDKLYLTTAGSIGQVLRSGGPGGVPFWTDVGAGTVQSIDVSGGTTGLTTSGGPVTTSGIITLGGTLNVASGGTGATTAATARTNLGLGTAAVLDAGIANGVATLDGGGTVPTSQLPAAVLGAVKYQGTWNATTNTPTLTSSVGSQGYYYVVSVAGATDLNGITDWEIGDWAIYNGTVWQKVDNTDKVTSVNGKTGTVVLVASDVGAPTTSGTGATGTWAIDISGNAATVTNGVYTNGSYSDPAWITSLAGSKISGTVTTATNLGGGAANRIAYQTGTGSTTFIVAPTNANTFLEWSGSAFQWSTNPLGTVTSVALSVPTGLTVSGSPITNSGTFAISLQSGYSIPTTSSQTNWDTAFTDRLKWDGGSTGLVPSTGRTSLGATTIGSNLFTLTNPSAITFPRLNADNTVSALDAATFRTAIGAGTGNGSVTSIALSGGTTGITVTGSPITTSGTFTLGGTLAVANGGTGVTTSTGSGSVVLSTSPVLTTPNLGTPSAATLTNATGLPLTTGVTGTLPVANGGTGAATLTGYVKGTGTSAMTASATIPGTDISGNISGNAANVTGTVAVANGGTGATTAGAARTNLGATTVGANVFTLTNPSAITFPRFNADNTVSTLDASTFRTAIGAGTGSVSSVAASGGTTGLTFSGSPITTSGTLTLSGTLAVANGGTGATTAGAARTSLSAAASGANTDITSIALTTGTISTTPSGGTDIVNKAYVDTLAASGIHFHQPVRVESPINLNATYNNGTAGVGATLTNAGTQAALVIDGVTVSVNDRVLIYQQTTQTQNGIYVVTSVGSGATNWVLTRSSDANTYVINSAAGLSEGSTVFVQQGTTGAGETYTCNTAGTITFGTTAISFAQISSAQIYSAGTGLTLAGTQFRITNTGLTASTYGSASSVPVIAFNAQGQATSVTNTSIAIAGSQITSGSVAVANGGTGATTAGAALTNLGAYPASNPNGYTSNVGTVTSVGGTGTVNGITLTGSVTTSGSLTLGGTLSGVSLTTQVTGTLPIANGGTGATTQAAARTNLGATTIGSNVLTLTNPSAITFPRFNADNTVSTLDAATFRTAIGAGTGTVTSVAFSGGTTGLTASGSPVTASGTITLAGTLAVANGGTGQTSYTNGQLLIGNTATGSLSKATLTAGSGISITNGNGSISIASTLSGGSVTSVNVAGGTTGLTFSGGPVTTSGTITMAGTLAVANGGTGATTQAAARTNLGATTVGSNLFTLTNPSAITFPRLNADNTVSTLDAATFRTAIGAGTGSGSVTSVSGSGGTTGLTLSGGPITSTGTLTLGGTLAAANGGTGQSSYAIGDLLFASTTSALSRLADVATGNALISGGVGVAPLWGKIGLTTHVSGTLPVANGGTGASTLAANNVLLGNGTSALQVVAPGTTGNVLVSNGTTWVSQAPAASGVSQARATALAMVFGL
jgi:hypothetical protein